MIKFKNLFIMLNNIDILIIIILKLKNLNLLYHFLFIRVMKSENLKNFKLKFLLISYMFKMLILFLILAEKKIT